MRWATVIKVRTDPRWTRAALADMDAVLIDHAHCEKKAAASAMMLVSTYPQHDELVRKLSGLAVEELRHFRQVHQRIIARGLSLTRDHGDPYAKALLGVVRTSDQERLTDRLLISGLIEARSHERLQLLADALEDQELSEFYASLAKAEAGHSVLFHDLAVQYDSAEAVEKRLDELVRLESLLVGTLPVEARIH